MSKKKKAKNNKQNSSQPVLSDKAVRVDSFATEDEAKSPAKIKEEEKKPSKEDKAQEKQKAKVDKKKKNGKEKGGLRRKTRETFAELKKVTWPSFADVCKKTGVVLVVVLIFAVVIFGIDYGLGQLMNLLR